MPRYRNLTTDKAFASRLVQAREHAQKTQHEAAKHVAVDTDTVSNWEAGRTEPRCSQIRALARLYGVSVSFFFEGTQT